MNTTVADVSDSDDDYFERLQASAPDDDYPTIKPTQVSDDSSCPTDFENNDEYFDRLQQESDRIESMVRPEDDIIWSLLEQQLNNEPPSRILLSASDLVGRMK
jgi:hypothetical protein